LHDVNIKIINKWKSPKSKGVYPIKWNISIPKEKINLTITPFFKSQELNTKKTSRIIYWEGAVSIFGQMNDKDISGLGYVEMTGYANYK
ncbi:MAG: lipocalin family protein, partial [Spirochaetota bacterium]|nr:lipocalin family protein [Spirochaetota bacterium]